MQSANVARTVTMDFQPYRVVAVNLAIAIQLAARATNATKKVDSAIADPNLPVETVLNAPHRVTCLSVTSAPVGVYKYVIYD